ncbi:hypothetical protein COLO4_13934 [Corchorus olitorius]|uniref:Uncharacterized protein n=1 Tax=Corchorus olitorius TaxID=93759 RepID=A0A1R3JUC7_9ROSI|nr:hypothetical protein COLO4_13934 [Corchorus olitorius]
MIDMIMMLQSTPPPKRVAQQTNKPHGAGNGGRRANIKKENGRTPTIPDYTWQSCGPCCYENSDRKATAK